MKSWICTIIHTFSSVFSIICDIQYSSRRRCDVTHSTWLQCRSSVINIHEHLYCRCQCCDWSVFSSRAAVHIFLLSLIYSWYLHGTIHMHFQFQFSFPLTVNTPSFKYHNQTYNINRRFSDEQRLNVKDWMVTRTISHQPS